MAHLRGDAARWPDDLHASSPGTGRTWSACTTTPACAGADLEQLAHIAAGQPSRERFVTELTLDPPEASSDEAGPPLRDEDYLILSTIHSAKGQEWNAVHVLNVVDGCLPADMATGRAAEIEEERRLLYVAMTRARDELTLWVPQRFHVTQQRAWGDRHLYALRSRFIPDALLPHFEVGAAGAAGRRHRRSRRPAGHATDRPGGALRHEWAPRLGGAPPPQGPDHGQNPG